jgi:hypothetical protein
MKSKYFNSVLFALVIMFSLTDCSSKKEAVPDTSEREMTNEQAENTMEATGPQFDVDPAFQSQLSIAFASYITLKDAFVSSDEAAVKELSGSTIDAVNAIDMKLLTGATHHDWMMYLEEIQTSLNEIKGNDDIETQRSAFSRLSDNFYKSIKAFGLGGATAYYEYCPMAFNNTGAYWLSDKSEIRNPYFGDKMLKCGSVEEKLK